MKYGKRDVYLVKRKRNWLVIPAVLLVLLVGGFLLLFSSLQKYIVYERGSLRVAPPALEQEADGEEEFLDTHRPEVTAGIVLDGYDFSSVQTDAGKGLSTIKAIYVPAGDMTELGLSSYVNRLEINHANALVLEVKPQSGQLSYASGVDMAKGYALNGTFELAPQAASLKEQGVYLVADIACCVDDLLAERNAALALKTQDGSVYRSDAGSWLDSYNTDVRKYLSDLCLELAAMGFDEVMLTYAAHPEAENLVYTQPMTTPPDAVSAVSSFSTYMEKTVGDKIKLSLRCSADALRNGVGSNGQDMDLLLRVYDRIYVSTDKNSVQSDLEKALSYMEEDVRSKDRFVPIAYTALTDDSWVVLTWSNPEEG